ncbi:MAG: hypothetical protein V4439_04415 [Patescibacteria group bacterium]
MEDIYFEILEYLYDRRNNRIPLKELETYFKKLYGTDWVDFVVGTIWGSREFAYKEGEFIKITEKGVREYLKEKTHRKSSKKYLLRQNIQNILTIFIGIAGLGLTGYTIYQNKEINKLKTQIETLNNQVVKQDSSIKELNKPLKVEIKAKK